MFTRQAGVLEIDVSAVRSGEALHALLSRAFEFPDYYGANWDAFNDCISSVPPPDVIRISGLESMRFRLPRDTKLFIECLRYFVEHRAVHPVSLHVG
jgi:RNAse (barnase) inhibitor barstar